MRVTRSEAAAAAKVLEQLTGDATVRLMTVDGRYVVAAPDCTGMSEAPRSVARMLIATGLVEEREPGRFAVGAAATAWLKRRERPDVAFLIQHGDIAAAPNPDSGERVLTNLDESPVAALARRSGKAGPLLAPHAVAAAERLRRDFEIGRLRPRVTANWSASVATGRRAEGATELADLTDMALAARTRFNAAIEAVGPELSGVLVDVCCFLKGLETVEHERQWPVRSAKIVLRIALEALARHYGLGAAAAGRAGAPIRHWGAEDYRPQVT
jgi:hypothetical protein